MKRKRTKHESDSISPSITVEAVFSFGDAFRTHPLLKNEKETKK